jgi:rsbT co-antagonist protein RsbR
MSSDTELVEQLLREERERVLSTWLDEQTNASTYRPDLMTPAELRAQAEGFIGVLSDALGADAASADTNGPAWAGVREFLDEITRSRATQGFSPTETATFIFSLKRPLFGLLQERHGQDAGTTIPALWAATRLIDELGLYTADAYLRTREDVIRRQQDELIELSTPVVKLWDGVVALPLIGTLDSARTQVVMESLLERIVQTDSTIAIIDITGVPTVDTLVAQHLLKTVAAARLMGADCIISGIRPQIAQTIVHLGLDLSEVTTKANLSEAVVVALAETGYEIVRRRTRD